MEASITMRHKSQEAVTVTTCAYRWKTLLEGAYAGTVGWIWGTWGWWDGVGVYMDGGMGLGLMGMVGWVWDL